MQPALYQLAFVAGSHDPGFLVSRHHLEQRAGGDVAAFEAHVRSADRRRGHDGFEEDRATFSDSVFYLQNPESNSQSQVATGSSQRMKRYA